MIEARVRGPCGVTAPGLIRRLFLAAIAARTDEDLAGRGGGTRVR